MRVSCRSVSLAPLRSPPFRTGTWSPSSGTSLLDRFNGRCATVLLSGLLLRAIRGGSPRVTTRQADHFATDKINNTFYRSPQPATSMAWRARASEPISIDMLGKRRYLSNFTCQFYGIAAGSHPPSPTSSLLGGRSVVSHVLNGGRRGFTKARLRAGDGKVVCPLKDQLCCTAPSLPSNREWEVVRLRRTI
jgi:hypothetical protein